MPLVSTQLAFPRTSRKAMGCVVMATFVFGMQLAAPAIGQPANPPGDSRFNEPVRKPDEVLKELDEVRNQISDLVPSMEAVLDEAKRAEMSPKALPLFRKLIKLFQELGRAIPEGKAQLTDAQLEIRAMMALMDDKQSVDELSRLTASKDDKEATDAKSWLLLLRWVQARKDAKAQEKLADDLLQLARFQPSNAMIAQAASLMPDAAATPALAEQIERVVSDELKNPLARRIGQSMASKRKLRSLSNHPLTIEGNTVGKTAFTSATWKGKVVLVDFWATWCPPCMADLPKIKQAFVDFHDKGLELVGVNSDRDSDDLRGFLAKNKEVSWPQLYNPGEGGIHQLATSLGVETLPTLILIDRKGIVRRVGNNTDILAMIPKLLEEKE